MNQPSLKILQQMSSMVFNMLMQGVLVHHRKILTEQVMLKRQLNFLMEKLTKRFEIKLNQHQEKNNSRQSTSWLPLNTLKKEKRFHLISWTNVKKIQMKCSLLPKI